MARVHSEISPEFAAFIAAQPLFFVASAPSEGGHVNLSPKGLDCFRVLGGDRVAYMDLTGSGNETAAHLLENGRITFMFCAFSGPPRILRLFGDGSVILPGTSRWEGLVHLFPEYPGERQIIEARVTRVQTSCGFAVPRMQLVGQRDTLLRWAEDRGEEGLKEYRKQKNAISIDGLPAPVAGSARPTGDLQIVVPAKAGDQGPAGEVEVAYSSGCSNHLSEPRTPAASFSGP